jgi:hypothetical protein
MDYFRMQTNKPMMLAVALADSPLGTAAWIAEKFWAWSDNDGDLDKVVVKSVMPCFHGRVGEDTAFPNRTDVVREIGFEDAPVTGGWRRSSESVSSAAWPR